MVVIFEFFILLLISKIIFFVGLLLRELCRVVVWLFVKWWVLLGVVILFWVVWFFRIGIFGVWVFVIGVNSNGKSVSVIVFCFILFFLCINILKNKNKVIISFGCDNFMIVVEKINFLLMRMF